MTYAKIIADSISPNDVRLTTMEVRFHRFVLAEFNTHRVFSRSSASSRAIPLAKQVQKIMDDLAMPVVFPLEQRGMQGGDAVDEQAEAQARDNWDKASKNAIIAAQAMGEIGVHKSISNRLLEPYMHHTVVVTSTAFENFFAQRCSPLAQPEIRVVAEMMREAMRESTPSLLTEGSWHLPYVGDDSEAMSQLAGRTEHPGQPWDLYAQVSAARCARVSYETQDGRRDVQADLDLYHGTPEKTGLLSAAPKHWAPLEHVATPWGLNTQQFEPIDFQGLDGQWHDVPTEHLPKIGNLLGWRSLRTEIETAEKATTFR